MWVYTCHVYRYLLGELLDRYKRLVHTRQRTHIPRAFVLAIYKFFRQSKAEFGWPQGTEGAGDSDPRDLCGRGALGVRESAHDLLAAPWTVPQEPYTVHLQELAVAEEWTRDHQVLLPMNDGLPGDIYGDVLWICKVCGITQTQSIVYF